MNAFLKKGRRSSGNDRNLLTVFRDIRALVHSSTGLEEVMDLVAKITEFKVSAVYIEKISL